MIKRLLSLALIGSLIGAGLGCDNEEPLESKLQQNPVVRTINGNDYRVEGNRVTEISSDEDDSASYGVISDIHGETKKARSFAEEFKRRGVVGIIISGDIPLNEGLRYGRRDSREDETEIKEVLSAVAETGLPVFVIPGNHERKHDYESALAKVTAEYENVIDMTRFRVFDGDDADFVSLPGYQVFKSGNMQFIPEDGYWVKPDTIRETGKLREGLDDAVVLITHGAGKTTGDYDRTKNPRVGPATTYSGQDVGDVLTREMQIKNDIQFGVVGHIHEAGGNAATFDGQMVEPGEWAKQFTANFGTLERCRYLNGKTYDGMAGIFTVRGDEAMYDILTPK
jgi:Icc-related predicted phosphoesterase